MLRYLLICANLIFCVIVLELKFRLLNSQLTHLQQFIKDTHCEDVSDKKQYNIAEVPLKDMFCDDGVKDKPATNKVSEQLNDVNKTMGCSHCWGMEPEDFALNKD